MREAFHINLRLEREEQKQKNEYLNFERKLMSESEKLN